MTLVADYLRAVVNAAGRLVNEAIAARFLARWIHRSLFG
jgi:hypothetical protein